VNKLLQVHPSQTVWALQFTFIRNSVWISDHIF